MKDLFKLATRKHYRYASEKGFLTTEDLWSLSLKDLDKVAKLANQQLKEQSEDSFISPQNSITQTLELKLEVIKAVIAQLQEEDLNRELAAQNRLQQQKIMEIIQRKQDEDLATLSVEELKARLEALNS